MKWNDHSKQKGEHSFLSPSKVTWIRYDDDKLIRVWNNSNAAEYGIEMHDLAARLIKHGFRLPARPRTTMSLYVNDAIGFRMDPEVVLYFSENAFGTADAIRFDERKNLLRIHDLKTGDSGEMDQLKIYAAFFCLEYNKVPTDISIELRLYKNNEVFIESPDPLDIRAIMDKTIRFDRLIKKESGMLL